MAPCSSAFEIDKSERYLYMMSNDSSSLFVEFDTRFNRLGRVISMQNIECGISSKIVASDSSLYFTAEVKGSKTGVICKYQVDQDTEFT